MKATRHYKAMIFNITQDYVNQLEKQARSLQDVLILGDTITKDRLKNIVKPELKDNQINYDTFESIYNHATKEPYNFLCIDSRRKSTYQKVNQDSFNNIYHITY